MTSELTFYGAAKNVTGSCSLLSIDKTTVVIDCGMFQERKLQYRNWIDFNFNPSSIDVVLLTHAHLDHCGRLPKLVKDGFRGKIVSTGPTLEIAKILLYDSAYLQLEDIKRKKKRHQKQQKVSPHPYEPLYTEEDVDKTVALFHPVGFEKPFSINSNVNATFFEAGHIFGSAMIQIDYKKNDISKRIIFSGDVGRWDLPIIRDPHQFDRADFVVVESTYGDRLHGTTASIPGELERVINDTFKRGGNIIIPGFAVERTQEILYHLTSLMKEKRIPPIHTFVDSPMAVSVTEIFKNHRELFDDETRVLIESGSSPYDFPGLTMSRTSEQSRAINNIRGVCIVIAGSGMCTGGRIKHHLVNNIRRKESTILFVGYQAVGTLGRQILEKPDEIRIFGEFIPVKAKIEKISGFSGHADRDELVRWLGSIKNPPEKIFINHGDETSAESFRKTLENRFSWKCEVVEYEKKYNLS
ncbi:MAG: MBL fold metallo-hydrolase [Deltaproteobacteria bacterium]|nr:MBL fold metallo-hydrolase [Deltaproteobacteria bacterium]